MSGKPYCVFHDPDAANTCAAGRQEGGRSRSRPRTTLPPDQPAVTVATVQDIPPLLSGTIHQVRTGALDPRVANTIGYLAGVLIRAFEVGALEERIARLEATTRLRTTGVRNSFDHHIDKRENSDVVTAEA